jgi:hypothetical protein
MSLRLLLAKVVDDKLVPVEYAPGTNQPTSGLRLQENWLLLDMSTTPPSVVHRNLDINYRFYEGLLPDTFIDMSGSLRSGKGEVIFSNLPRSVNEPHSQKKPYLDHHTMCHG